jgi:DNA-binding transcriptional MerR regulator
MENFNNYVTIREAAKMLGVCEATLRRWDKLGKLNNLKSLIRTATSNG